MPTTVPTDPAQAQEYTTAYATEAQRAVEVLANELRTFADRLVTVGQQFSTTDRCASVAAQIVSAYVQGIGGIPGARLWSIVHNAGEADRHGPA